MFGGIAVAKNLLCLAYSEVRGKIFLFDLDERRLVSFWEYGPEEQAGYADAGGVAMALDFSIYVADTRNDVVRCFTPFGKQVRQLGVPVNRGPGAMARDRAGVLDRPRNVAVWESTVFVACGERELRRGVQRFERSGAIIKPLPAFGDVTKRFGAPRGIWVDELGIVVADTLHGVVQRFGPGGQFIGDFKTAGVAGESSRPVAVLRLSDGDLLVADHGDRRGIWRFSCDGVPHGPLRVDFDDPVDLASDHKGRIYVLDRDGERVQRLRPDLSLEGLIVDVAEILHGD